MYKISRFDGMERVRASEYEMAGNEITKAFVIDEQNRKICISFNTIRSELSGVEKLEITAFLFFKQIAI